MNLFASENRRRLVLKPGKERVVANRHPWIFAGAIAGESGAPDAAIADLVDRSGARIASGFYSASSQIRLRALTFGDEELSASTIEDRVTAAVRRREPILRNGTNAARLVHSEGDDLSGLVIDRYSDMIVIEIANSGLEKLKDLVASNLERTLQPRLVYYKNDLPARMLERLPSEPQAVGEGEAITEILENGLRFLIDARQGQKTGFFLDQRENRALARTLASGKSVINLFAYTGAFGVYAAAGGATHVENVDVSAPAIEMARRNHALNGSEAAFTVADAFAFVRERTAAKETADFVICDPPAFAKSRAEVDRAARGYKDINLYALRMVKPGGMLMTFSCSGHMSIDLFQKIVFSAAADAGRRVAFVRRLTAGPDHPVSLFAPEGEYLKGFLLEVR
jgi:23S rRNA (cytosine1962-C5)-methyltransferase